MKEKTEEVKKQRTRKVYEHAGGRSQVMMSFRVDKELIEYLNSKPNKGRFINELIAEAMRRENEVKTDKK